jgi:pilus assembly protein CpaB
MGRRTVLLIVAALIAALGTGMVFLYVRGADTRAEASQQPVQVLKAVKLIAAGQTVAAAQASGSIQLGSVPRKEVLSGAVTSVGGMTNQVALSAIYPNEQIISSKFGAASDQSALTIPNGNVAISVTLSDTGRVAGFVSPGNKVAIFTATSGASGASGGDTTRLLLPRVQVIAVGATTVTPTTTTSAEGAQTVEQLPKTLFTLSVDQVQAEKVLFASTHGALSFALLNSRSRIAAGPGISARNLFQ